MKKNSKGKFTVYLEFYNWKVLKNKVNANHEIHEKKKVNFKSLFMKIKTYKLKHILQKFLFRSF